MKYSIQAFVKSFIYDTDYRFWACWLKRNGGMAAVYHKEMWGNACKH